MKRTLMNMSLFALALSSGSAFSQTINYGTPISLEVAKKVANACAKSLLP
ncbi:hypothetical protein ACO0LD_05820 [Undibacterium sp. Ji83W]